MDLLAAHLGLKKAIREGAPTLGLFIKTPAVQVLEVLADKGLDFVALDGEHAPFGSDDLDRCIMAGRSVGLPVLVRVREATPPRILEVLDMGAAGVIGPHIESVEQARRLAAACRYSSGSRGFSGLTRASGYGALPPDQHRKVSDDSVIVIGQIEDAAGVAAVDEIAAVEELDALFIGRADLAVSLGVSSLTDPAVADGVAKVLAAGETHGRATGLYLPGVEECAQFQGQGASLFIISSDQNLLMNSVAAMTAAFGNVVRDNNGR